MNNLNIQTVIRLDTPLAAEIASKSFSGASAGNEHFVSVEAPAGLTFSEQLDIVEQRYAQAIESLALGPQSAVFRRIFLSDVLNQADLVHKSILVAETPGNPVAVSIVQQPPLSGAKIALLAYHIESPGPFVKQRISPQHVIIEKNGLRHLWSTRLCTGGSDSSPAPVTEQTRQAFADLIDTLSDLGGTLRDHCIRTWIYLRNVDIFYQGMVDSRTELFEEQGLTADTHYIASTGIEGACAHRSDLVMMDAYSVLGMAPQQMSFLNDFEHLCATKDYNVTFERGTRIAYADRAHHFISGTASIDTAGRVVHPGDVLKQLGLALTNVDALLRSGAAGLDNMMHLLVYLRDPTDYASVRQYLSARFPELPILIVQGAVCRPDWLIEVECIAMVAHDEPELPGF